MLKFRLSDIWSHEDISTVWSCLLQSTGVKRKLFMRRVAPSSVTLCPIYCHSGGNEDFPLDNSPLLHRSFVIHFASNHCLILSLFLVVLHNGTEDCFQQDELLCDCTVRCRNHAVSGLCDTTDSFTDPAHLIHHLDGGLTASGETAQEKRLSHTSGS